MGICNRLFALVLGKVDGHSDSDDDAFDNLLPHRADADELQAILDNGEDQHAADDAADGTDTTVQRYAANHASCDGVCFIAVAVVVRCTCGSGCFQDAADAVHEGSEDEDQHDGLEYVDAGNDSRFTVAADRVNVLAKGGLIQDKPNGNGEEDSDRDQNRNSSKQLGLAKCGEVRTDTADRLGAVRRHIEIQGTCAVDHNLDSQGCDEGVHVILCNQESVQSTKQHAGDDCHNNRQEYRQLRKIRIEPVRIGSRLQHGGGNNCRQADHTACGQVRTGDQEGEADAQCDDQSCGGLRQDIQDDLNLHETGLNEADDNNQYQQCQHNGVIRQEILCGSCRKEDFRVEAMPPYNLENTVNDGSYADAYNKPGQIKCFFRIQDKRKDDAENSQHNTDANKNSRILLARDALRVLHN